MPMDAKAQAKTQVREILYKRAYALALITVLYNLLEGLVSVFFGAEDETLSLFGFGLDSFVEVISGLGIWHMIRRLRRHADGELDKFEKQALSITGTGFYILAAGLLLTAGANLYTGHKPETTFWGIVVAGVSIISMGALIHYKVKVGRQLNSQAILADANCSRACLYLSLALLLASAGYEATGIGGIDSVGAMVIAGLAFREGRESFQKTRGEGCSCGTMCQL